jgi:hypothetical protein
MKRFLLLSAPLALLASGALAAAPQSYRDDSYRGGSRGDRYRGDAVVEIAHELELAARDLPRSAEAASHHGDRREERLLRSLHQLETRARHFHREVERYRQDPYHAAGDFRVLWDTFDSAAQTLHGGHVFRGIERKFTRVEYLVDQLAEVYGYGSHHDSYDGHDRYQRRGGWDDGGRGRGRRPGFGGQVRIVWPF